MVKKKVDSRVRTLIENGVALQHRSFFVLVGDKGRDQVVNLHYMLSKAQVKAIAEEKLKDLNTTNIEAAMRVVAGTARSMGVTVEG